MAAVPNATAPSSATFKEHSSDYFEKHKELLTHRKSVPEKQHVFPKVCVKKIMKQDSCDPAPHQIGRLSVPLMSLCTHLFIGHITYIAWKMSTDPDKRNTIQLKDIKRSLQSSIKFDFLVDLVQAYDETMEEEAAKHEGKQGKNSQAEMMEVPGGLSPVESDSEIVNAIASFEGQMRKEHRDTSSGLEFNIDAIGAALFANCMESNLVAPTAPYTGADSTKRNGRSSFDTNNEMTNEDMDIGPQSPPGFPNDLGEMIDCRYNLRDDLIHWEDDELLSLLCDQPSESNCLAVYLQ